MKGKKATALITAFSMLFLLSGCFGERVNSKEPQQRENEGSTEISYVKESTEAAPLKDSITFKVLDGNEITVEKSRLSDTDRVNNRWSIEEVDAILTPLQGTWRSDSYMGYILPDLCKFLPDDNIGEETKKKLLEEYDDEVREAENTIPDIEIEFRMPTKYEKENAVWVNNYNSPFSIILSTARINDYYPSYRDSTTYSESFLVEYPVIYIKLFARFEEEAAEIYKPATIVVSADHQVMLLIEGAFYSLERRAE